MPAVYAAPVDPLQVGDRGDEVLAVQEKLSQMGYVVGSMDGVYGDVTAEAVKMMQNFGGKGPAGQPRRPDRDSQASAAVQLPAHRRSVLVWRDDSPRVRLLRLYAVCFCQYRGQFAPYGGWTVRGGTAGVCRTTATRRSGIF